MKKNDVSKVEGFIRQSNCCERIVKMAPIVKQGILWSIEVRFPANIFGKIPNEGINAIYDRIEEESKSRILPVRAPQHLRGGILELKVSYISRACGARLIIGTLKDIKEIIKNKGVKKISKQ